MQPFFAGLAKVCGRGRNRRQSLPSGPPLGNPFNNSFHPKKAKVAKQVVRIVGARGSLLACFFSSPCNLSSRVMLRSSAARFVVLNFKILIKLIACFRCKQKKNSRHDEYFDSYGSVASIAI